MRYLNKIIFINSAACNYAEIMLDGNIHFIGTQGVGKSTILRAVLFFYNANTQKLGISREKQNFAEYYFFYKNSYILYEVKKGQNSYTVCAFKSQGKICFRFLDCAYQKELFLDKHGKAYDNWDSIRSQLDPHNIDYSRKISKYEAYRDIIYGNNQGRKEFVKYALLESKRYQNIPRTIQNVFLNSKLEAEFIKDTIIRSLNEEDVKISLSTYNYEMQHFEHDMQDLQQFQRKAVLKQADSISSLYTEIVSLQQDKEQFSRYLGYMLLETRKNIPLLQTGLSSEDENLHKTLAKQQRLARNFETKKDEMTAEVAVLKQQLKLIKNKSAAYEQKGITDILQKAAFEKDLEQEKKRITEEINLLTSLYRETTEKFKALFSSLDNNLTGYSNEKTAEKNEVISSRNSDREAIRKQYELINEEISKQFKQNREQEKKDIETLREALNTLKIKREQVRHTSSFQAEIESLQKRIDMQINITTNSENSCVLIEGQLDNLTKQGHLEKENLERTYQLHQEKIEDFKRAAIIKIDELRERLANSKGSFYDWLSGNYIGWEENIGRICKEEILFNKELSPRLTGSQTNNFFGVEIDAGEILEQVKTLPDYEKKMIDFQRQVEIKEKELAHLTLKLEHGTDKITQKYNSKIKELNDELQAHEFKAKQAAAREKSSRLELQDLKEKTRQIKEKALTALEQEIMQVNTRLKDAKEKLGKIDRTINRRLKEKNKEKQERLNALDNESREKLANISSELSSFEGACQIRRKELEEQQLNELTSGGADTERLERGQQQLQRISSELDFIKQKQTLIIEYKKDKRELFDRLAEFKHERKLLENKLEQLNIQYTADKELVEKQIKTIEEAQKQIRTSLDEAKADLEEFHKLTETEFFGEISEIITNFPERDEVLKRCEAYISDIKEVHYGIIRRESGLSEAVNKFLSHFSSNNIFSFKTTLIGLSAYLRFAEELSNFIRDNRINEYEKRVNERYASIIKLIGKETTELTSREGEIQKIITRINRDFTEKNFVGVISKVELRLDESDNRIVLLLKMIKKFNDESGLEVGMANLFSHSGNDSNNKKAVDLLKQLVKEINRFPRDYISISDSFSLKFRIVENQNDTGWVERIANVGSEGTDVLVKAMINIMLLNTFKEGASKKFSDFRLHCMMDEIGRLHPGNVRGILKFANDRNIMLVNGSPTEHDALAYKHIYKFDKDNDSITRVKRIISNY